MSPSDSLFSFNIFLRLAIGITYPVHSFELPVCHLIVHYTIYPLSCSRRFRVHLQLFPDTSNSAVISH